MRREENSKCERIETNAKRKHTKNRKRIEGKRKERKKKRNTAQEVSLILTKKKYRVIGKEKRKDNMI